MKIDRPHITLSPISFDFSATAVFTTFVTLTGNVTGTVSEINCFNSSGETLALGITTTTDLLYIFPGGLDGNVQVSIPSGSALYIRSIGATASAGKLQMNLFSFSRGVYI